MRLTQRSRESRPYTTTSRLLSRQPTNLVMSSITDRVQERMVTTKMATQSLSVSPHKSHNRLPSNKIVNKVEAIKSSRSVYRVITIAIQPSSRLIWLKSSARGILPVQPQRKPGQVTQSETLTTPSTSTVKQICHRTRIQMSTRSNCSRLTREIFLQKVL